MAMVPHHESRCCEMTVDLSPRAAPTSGADPALLAFVKCHLSSFLRWDVLRTLAAGEGRWLELEALASVLHKPAPAVRHTLEALTVEGIGEERSDSREPLGYR